MADTPNTPAAPDNPQGQNPGETTPPPAQQPDKSESEIKDPEAWAKSQVEKMQRLLDKATKEAEASKTQLALFDETTRKKYEADMKKLQDEMAAERDQAKKELVEARRAKIGAELGLPAEIVARLQGETEVEIRKDAEPFAKYGKKQPAAPGRVGNTPDGVTLTMDEIKRLSPQEYIRRKDEVDAALKKLGSK